MKEKLLSRAINKDKLGAVFSSDMSREEMKAALKSARDKAKAFHNKNDDWDDI